MEGNNLSAHSALSLQLCSVSLFWIACSKTPCATLLSPKFWAEIETEVLVLWCFGALVLWCFGATEM
jgi:hypothetical protein